MTLQNHRDEMQEALGGSASDKTILVHKENVEGALVINALTGIIISPPDERPEWCEGLASALTAERYQFYLSRLGKDYVTGTLRNEQAVAFEDLGWLAIDADGEPVELEADAEWRMTKIAEITGITRTNDLEQESASQDETASAFIEMGTKYDSEEVHALEKAQEADFPAQTGTK